MRIPLYQVDAFTDKRFHGNPAAICPLDHWLPDAVLQAIAAENNLSETAFYVRGNGTHASGGNEWATSGGLHVDLRWFTPAVEVDLCGHATLAAALVILDVRKEISAELVEFRTKSGTLVVRRDGDRYALDFPARPPPPAMCIRIWPPRSVPRLSKCSPREIIFASMRARTKFGRSRPTWRNLQRSTASGRS
jgi:predicted PhzF superfamily epimerase YddE/YHI9